MTDTSSLGSDNQGRRASDLPDGLVDPLEAEIRAAGFAAKNLDEHLTIALAAAEDSLESLFADAMQGVRDAEGAKQARERLKRGGTTAQERAEDAERIRQWELKHEWIAQANVAAFDRFCCTTCNTQHTVFAGLMVRQKHRHLGHAATRWQAVKESQAGLENEVAYRTIERPMCPDCAEAVFGWPLQDEAAAKEWK